MKRVVKHKEAIFCMAIINPVLCKNSSIEIEVEQRNEGSIPHLHVYLDKTRNPKNCAYVRLDKAEYAPHHDSKNMSKKQKREFISILEANWDLHFIRSRTTECIKEASGYEGAVQTWIETYGETMPFTYDEEGYPVMPDYNNL